ncbi:MAG TPA: flagellar protein FlaG [Steroidobacteraceae bacterium]|nr:flagellar protein FlaG [Steroidobacteraceae bacterium]
MAEPISSINTVGAAGAMDDFVSAHDQSPSPQARSKPPAPPATTGEQGQRPSPQVLQYAVDQINAHLAGVDRVLSLRVDPLSGMTVAQISNAKTGEVLQQYPTEDRLQLELMLARWSHGGNVLMDVEA